MCMSTTEDVVFLVRRQGVSLVSNSFSLCNKCEAYNIKYLVSNSGTCQYDYDRNESIRAYPSAYAISAKLKGPDSETV
jgi:hypothetical protein